MKTKLLNLLVLMLATTIAKAQTEPIISAANADELITENSLAGWQVPNASRWSVSGSTITGDTQGVTLDQPEWIYTTTEYDDFVFSMEVRLNGDANSGIYFRSEIIDWRGRYEAPSGYEYDLAIDSGLNASIGDFFGRGGGYRFRADQTVVNSVFEPDGWNRITIRAEGNYIEYWMNGTKVNEIVDTDTDRNTVGLIGIQLHDALVMSVEFRNAFIQDLNEEVILPTSTFTPDPSKTYFIDNPHHNLRLAATGESEDAYAASTTTTADNVEWQFVAKGNGSWHVQRAAGGTKPRLRTDNSEAVDMQETTSSGTFTYFDMESTGSGDTYFFTLPDGPSDYQRLQIDNRGDVNMVESTRDGTWESFTITEAGTTTNVEDIRIQAEDYDSMSGIQTEGTTDTNGGENVGWINNGDWLRFDDVNLSGFSNIDTRIACNYTGGSIEIRTGSTTGTLIGSISITNTGGNQDWETLNTSISNINGTQDVYLVFTGGSGYLFNVNWIELNNSSTANKDVVAFAEENQVLIYPNPVTSTTIIANAINSTVNIYDLNGSIVFTTVISNEREVIDLSKLATGIYYTEVVGFGLNSIVKLVKN